MKVRLGYGLNPPAVGFDFFQGPFADYFDGRDNDRDGCPDGVRNDEGNCIPENPVTGVNESVSSCQVSCTITTLQMRYQVTRIMVLNSITT